jgi:stearoyl-CoA desaturase (Delta-9 desaturase)
MTRLRRNTNLAAVVLPFAAFIASVPLLWNHLVTPLDLAILVVGYVVNISSVTIGFHRLLTHRSFATHRPIEYALAVLGSMAVQGPLINWVADHRKHHAHADTDGDPHSPHVGHGGEWRRLCHAHVGWLLTHVSGSEAQRYAPELLEDPVIRAINRAFVTLTTISLLIPFTIGWLATGRLAGAALALFWGGLVRVFVVHHVAWSTNSICHFFGRRRFETTDRSTNVFWLALPSLGEAWHHNHHAFPRSALHGLRSWELDISGLIIRAMEKAGVAWNVVRIDKQRQGAKTASPPPQGTTTAAATKRGSADVSGSRLSDPLERARRGEANRLIYWAARAIVHPIFAVVFRLKRTGREHIPHSGPLILAANHRSVLDPIIVGLLLRRPVYYMAKKELFRKRRHAWLLSALGAFPVDRGGADLKAIDVAREVLQRGDCLAIFPEGRCMPPGPLGKPRRGVGRLALATGASVLPVAITGSEATSIRRFPPRRIRVHAGPPLTFTADENSTKPNATCHATDRIWAAINAQWKTLSGTPTHSTHAIDERRSASSKPATASEAMGGA